MSQATKHQDGIPTWVITSIGAIMLAAIVMSAISAQQIQPSTPSLSEGGSAVLAERMLVVTDQPNLTITIEDAADGTLLETIDRDSNGFIRGALRGLARQRGLEGIGSGEPFRLRLFEDGTLVLDDPTTSQVVTLNGFGRDNTKAFGKYLMINSGE